MTAIGRYSKIDGRFIPKKIEYERTYTIDENGMIHIESEKAKEHDSV